MKYKQWGLIGLLLFLTACDLLGGGNDAAPVSTPDPRFLVAAITVGSVNDGAFNQGLRDVLAILQREQSEANFGYAIAENVSEADAPNKLREYAEIGYEIVMAHSTAFGTAVQQVAPEFPNTVFVWGMGQDTFGMANVSSYTAVAHEGGYVLGVLAAQLTQSGIVGVVGSVETGDVKQYIDGFRAGVQAANANVTVNVIYTNSSSDIAAASGAAQTHLSNGADVLTGAGTAVMGAIRVAESNNIPWLGTQASQFTLAPRVIAATQTYDWKIVLQPLIADVQNGLMAGQIHTLTMQNGGLKLEYNEDYDFPDGAIDPTNAAIDGILDGSITIQLPPSGN